MIHILERFLVSSPSQCFVLQLQTTFKQVLNGTSVFHIGQRCSVHSESFARLDIDSVRRETPFSIYLSLLAHGTTLAPGWQGVTPLIPDQRLPARGLRLPSHRLTTELEFIPWQQQPWEPAHLIFWWGWLLIGVGVLAFLLLRYVVAYPWSRWRILI